MKIRRAYLCNKGEIPWFQMHDSSYVDDSCGWDKSLLIFSFREDAKNNQVIKVGLFKYLYLSNTFKSFFRIKKIYNF